MDISVCFMIDSINLVDYLWSLESKASSVMNLVGLGIGSEKSVRLRRKFKTIL